MAETRPVVPVLLVVAGFSRHDEALRWGRERLEQTSRPVGLASEPFLFDQTSYYEATMGPDLRKQLLAFERLVPPDCLPDVKLHTNALEGELAATRTFPEERPLNLDPGLLALGKFLLATTKDQAHRIDLRDGILGKERLSNSVAAWNRWPCTSAEYRLAAVHTFLEQARDFYRNRLQETSR